MEAIVVLGPIWVALGFVVLISGILARRSERSLQVGCIAVSVLWGLAGAAVNTSFLLTGADYSGFADGADIRFVTDTWESLVVPHHYVFIGLLVAFEAFAALLVLVPGRLRETALMALMGFNIALLSFGLPFALWSLPITLALGLLLKAERRRSDRDAVSEAPRVLEDAR